MVKRGHRSKVRPPVKHNKKAIVISLLLATLGVISAVYLYQYTHTAKLEKQFNQVQLELEKTNSQLDSTVQNKSELEKQVEELNKVKSDLEAQLQAKKEREAKLASIAKQTALASSVKPTTASSNCDTLRSQLSRLGITGAELNAAITLATRESSCRDGAVNASSGACGAFQSLPCGKWGAPGTDQYLRGAINYAKSRYGGFVAALNHSYAKGWY